MDQRRRLIARWLEEAGRLDVTAAARRLGVAPETIRRDLRRLESAGRLQRVHGGAVRVEQPPAALVPVAHHPAVPETAADDAWARALWGRLAGAGTIVLGGGAAVLTLARVMVADPPARELTLVTTSLDVALLLAPCRCLTVLHLGGVATVAGAAAGYPQEGEWALSEMRRIEADVSVVCPAGVAPERGLSEPSTWAAALCRAQVLAGRRVVTLVSEASAGSGALVRACGLDQVDELVLTAPPASDDSRALVRWAGERTDPKSEDH